AWVRYRQARGVYLQHLHDGSADPAVKLAAADPALSSSVTVCANGRVYAASLDTARQQTHVQEFGTQAQPSGEIVLAAAGPTSLACHAGGAAVLVADQGHARLFLLAFSTPPTPPRQTEQPAGRLAADPTGTTIWLVTSRIGAGAGAYT